MGLSKFSKSSDNFRDDFLLNEDKEKIDTMTKKKAQYLQKASELDSEIIQIQKSTRTLIPNFIPLHNNLRQKYSWYYKWHTKAYAKIIHWLVLLLYIVGVPLLALDVVHLPKDVVAKTYDIPRWTWVNPLPVGISMSGIYADSQNNMWVCGVGGRIIKYERSTGQWENNLYTGVTKALTDISGYDDANIWAVGYIGTILKYDGSTWSSQSSDTNQVLKGITAISGSAVWTVGGTGTILKYNGSSWSAQTSGTAEYLNGVSAVDKSTLWAVGDSGTILYTDDGGSSWSAQASGTAEDLNGVYAVDDSIAWAVGDNGTILYTGNGGSSWAAQASGVVAGLYGIYAGDSSAAWAVGRDAGGGPVILNTTNGGANWSGQTPAGTTALNDVAGISSSEVWAVGPGAITGAFPNITKTVNGGTNWTSSITGGTTGYNSVTVLETNNIWLSQATAPGTIQHYDGSTWDTYNTNSSGDPLSYIRSVDGYDADNIWAVGDSGKIYQYNSSNDWWDEQVSGIADIIRDVTAFSANSIWAVADNVAGGSKLLKYDGAWSVDYTFTDHQLNHISAGADGVVWAVGADGAILKYNGVGWSEQVSGTVQDIVGVSAVDENNVWAGKFLGGALSTSDGGANWQSHSFGAADYELSSVTAVDADTAWVTAVGGVIAKTVDGGGSWNEQVSGAHIFNSIDAFSNTYAWTVGNQGSVLNYLAPENATATNLLVVLPGQIFSSGDGVSGTPSSVRAGDSVTATIYAVDNNDYRDVSNASIVGFTSTDPNDTNPSNTQLTPTGCDQTSVNPCGKGTTNFTFHTPGTWTVTTADINHVLSSGTSSQITVTAGSASQLYCEDCPSSLGMGSVSGAITVGVKDLYGNSTTVSSNKTVHLATSSSSGRFATSATGPWSAGSIDLQISAGSESGTASFYYLDFATGTANITATSSGLSSTICSITIDSGKLDESTLSVDKSSVVPGESLTATAIVKNSEGLALANRTIQLASDRNSAASSPDSISGNAVTDTTGVASFTVTPSETGSLTLTAYDQTDDAYIPQTAGVSVGIGEAASIDLSASASSVNAGSPLGISVTLYDGYSNIVTDFAGDINFSSSDGSASFQEGNHSFSSADQGTYSQEVILNTPGSQSITASSNGTQDTIYVTVLGEEIAETASPTAFPGAGTTSPTPSPSPSPETLVERLRESPTVKKVARTLTPIATTAAALGLLPLLIQAFPSGFHALAALFPALFAAATIRRRRKPWGMVFDSLSGKPIELAVVRVFSDSNDKLIATKVTDQDGRFNFLVEKGTYYLKVAKPGFIFPARIAKIKADQLSTRFGPETDVYLGQSFAVNTPNANINLNIALDPKENTLSGSDKLKKSLKDGFDWFLIGISYVALPMLIIGAIFTSFALVVEPTTFNMGLAIVYTALLSGFIIVRRIRQTKLGIVFDSKTRKPIKGAIVSCFDKEFNALRETKATDTNGYFSILAPKGEYYLTIDAKGYHFPAKDQGRKEDRILGKLYYGETIKNTKTAYLKASVPLEKKY